MPPVEEFERQGGSLADVQAKTRQLTRELGYDEVVPDHIG